MKKNPRVFPTLIFQNMNKKVEVEGNLYTAIKIINFPVPKGVKFFLSDDIANDSMFFTTREWKENFRGGNKPVICCDRYDINLAVLLHEIGHFLHYKNNRSEFEYGDASLIEERANEYGAKYYKEVTGKIITVYDDVLGWGDYNWKFA
jgi:hypothetical protein